MKQLDSMPDRRFSQRLFASIFIAIVATNATAQDGDLSFISTQLEPGLYMLEGQGGFTGGNLGLLTGVDGVVLIDDGLAELTALTLSAVEEITDGNVNFVINTHAHGDHTGANPAMHARGATIVGHENLRRTLVNDDDFDRSGIPELTFDESVTFHLNGHTAKVFHLASAHTDGDAAIYFPEADVLHTGDVMFNRMFPFIDLNSGGTVDGFIAAQQEMHSMISDETRIIPGHGAIANKSDLKASIDMLIDAQQKISALVDDGLTLDQVVARNPLRDYASWSWDFITTEVMIETLHQSLAGQ